MNNQTAGIAEGWNAGFADQADWEMKPRDYLWASELGNSPIDLYLRLKGEKPSNPPNERAKRKMGAGVDWEFTIEQILKSAGILLETQVNCQHQYEGLMRVSGKLDFLIGGRADLEKAKAYLIAGRDYISPNRERAAERAIEYYHKKYPEGFEPMPIELKSISDYAMEEMEKSNKPIARNVKQLTHYLISKGYKRGILAYLNRNDERMMEFVIELTPEIEAEYRKPIEIISKYFMQSIEPPKEKLIIWDEYTCKFSKNLNVSWSNYLTRLYGFKEPREYDEIYSKKATQWNGLLARVKKGAKMTPKNLEWQADIEAQGYNVAELVAKMPDNVPEEEETV